MVAVALVECPTVSDCRLSGAVGPLPLSLQQPLLVPAVTRSAMGVPFSQGCMKVDLVQSAIARPKSIGSL